MKKIKKIKGITLIELLVVLAIIAILSLIAYTSLSQTREEARKSSLKATMDTLAPSAETYALNHQFSYEGFCNPGGPVDGIKSSCSKIYNDCQCSCSHSQTTWSVTCSSYGGGFSWTCENDGAKTSCHE